MPQPKPTKSGPLPELAKDPSVEAFLLRLGWFIEEQKLNQNILEPILRHLMLVDSGTGYHTIEIRVKNHRVISIVGADTQVIDQSIRI